MSKFEIYLDKEKTKRAEYEVDKNGFAILDKDLTRGNRKNYKG